MYNHNDEDEKIMEFLKLVQVTSKYRNYKK